MIYQATKEDGNSEWIYFNGIEKQRFATRALALTAEAEANQMAREQAFISEVRARARAHWESHQALKALQAEWNALDYATNLDDGEGENAGITKAQIGSVLFDTTNAIADLLDDGHATNLAKLL